MEKEIVRNVVESPQENIREQNQRTARQNSALHKYFKLLADSLNDSGYDMKHIITVDIPWSSDTVKQWLWKPVQKAQLLKESTTELTTAEVNKVYETINRLMAEKFNIHVPFPSDEISMLQSYDE